MKARSHRRRNATHRIYTLNVLHYCVAARRISVHITRVHGPSRAVHTARELG